MDKITDRLWIGNAEDGRSVLLLEAKGITAVFNATLETDNWSQAFKDKVPYLRLNQQDGEPIPREKIVEFLAWMWARWLERKTILIHCGAGVSRAATFAILWLMLIYDLTWDEAEELVRLVRPIISPSPVLKQSVMDYLGWPDDTLGSTARAGESG